jgi:hypothetical protein
MTKLIDDFRNFANTPENDKTIPNTSNNVESKKTITLVLVTQLLYYLPGWAKTRYVLLGRHN